MADSKITQLTELAAAAREDLLAIVDDPSGSPTTKKITIANFFDKLSTTLAALGAQPDQADELLMIDDVGGTATAKTVTFANARHFVPLTTPYTNTTFDGDSFSDVATSTKIENTSWSTTIPAGAVALVVQARARDSDSAGTTGLYVRLFSTSGGTVSAMNMYLNGLPNDTFTTQSAIVPCTDGDIWYQINASGASTLDLYLTCIGYWM